VFDRGFLYGDGVFETMRVYGGHVFRWNEHLARLAVGLQFLGIEPPLSPEEMRAAGRVLIERNHLWDGVIRVYVTSGTGEWGTVAASTLVIFAQPRVYEAVRLRAVLSSIRIDPPVSAHKTANRIPYLLARLEARRAHADEAVLRNRAGHVAEFFAANLFAVRRGTLYTPPLEDGPLNGITRRAVLELAGAAKIPVSESSFPPEFLADADEVFATNSLIEVVPVSAIGDRAYDAVPVTLRLQTAYRQLVREELALT
jgi:branched-subunit amino acid aminotransferase/4-amino-4-deoxychorismate lyase